MICLERHRRFRFCMVCFIVYPTVSTATTICCRSSLQLWALPLVFSTLLASWLLAEISKAQRVTRITLRILIRKRETSKQKWGKKFSDRNNNTESKPWIRFSFFFYAVRCGCVGPIKCVCVSLVLIRRVLYDLLPKKSSCVWGESVEGWMFWVEKKVCWMWVLCMSSFTKKTFLSSLFFACSSVVANAWTLFSSPVITAYIYEICSQHTQRRWILCYFYCF